MKQAIPTVHLIDDDTAFLAAIGRLFRAAGLTVAQFASAQEFLAKRTRLNGLSIASAASQLGQARLPIFLTKDLCPEMTITHT